MTVSQVYIGTTNYGKHWLDAPAAASWLRMVRDGCPPSGITDAGRTHQEQVDVFLKYFTTDYASSAKHDPRTWQGRMYWRRPGKPSAATPGSSQARHVSGRALDLNGATKAWVRANGHRYGWIKDIVRGEDWHMEYQGARDVVLVSNPGAVTGKVPTSPDVSEIAPIAPTRPQEVVVKILKTDRGNYYRVGETTFVQLYTAAQVVSAQKVWPTVDVTEADAQEELRRVQNATAYLRKAVIGLTDLDVERIRDDAVVAGLELSKGHVRGSVIHLQRGTTPPPA